MIHVTVREHSRLTTAVVPPGLDCHTVTATAFKYLCELAAGFRKAGANLVQIESTLSLRLDNYVGVIETPCGTLIEILPKGIDGADQNERSRQMLIKMLGVVLELPYRQADETDIALLRRPLTEWVMRQFLLALDHLVKRGVRFDYLRVDAEERFLRGQLDVARQLRQPPEKRHLFQLRHDVFSPDLPQNRLLRSALTRICAATGDAQNWRLSHELNTLLSELPSSPDIAGDFSSWRDDRLAAHYRRVRPWCELVLGNQMPLAQKGIRRGMSLLFPMERLFEDYVARRLRSQLPPSVHMTRHAASEYLCRHDGGNAFQLQPDLLLAGPGGRWVLDTKWKLLDQQDKAAKYGISQSDIYQMFGYGHKYLKAEGELFLIYPKTSKFSWELPPFEYSDTLRLRVIPFDLDADRLCASGLAFLDNHKALSALPLVA